MVKISTLVFKEGDIVTFDIDYVKQAGLEIVIPHIHARVVQEICEDGSILLSDFWDAIPIEYVLPIPIDSEIAKQVYYSELRNPYKKCDVYSIPPFMETLSKFPLFEQLQSANLQYVHEVQHWLEKHSMRELEVYVFYGMRRPIYV